MQLTIEPWWRTDTYDLPDANDGPNLDDPNLWGPKGPALVPYWPGSGKTGPGWGSETFMKAYLSHEFSPRRVLAGYDKGRHAFAFVMRAAKLVCVDIDGKNGGFDHASELGFLPPTTAEVSMSGNGYHLFYEVEDEWDPIEGFGKFRDAIGIVTGVDIRGTGCVYHKPTQRWNSQKLAKLPQHLATRLLQRNASRRQQLDIITKTLEQDEDEVLIMHDELMTELGKPITQGKRNQTLFAIGSKMAYAQVPLWEDHLRERATQVGIDDDEADKLVANILKYGAQ